MTGWRRRRPNSGSMRAGAAWLRMKYNRDTVKEWAGDSPWRALRADYQRLREQGHSGWGSEGFWALAIYRAQQALRKSQRRRLWAPAALLLAILRKALQIVTGLDLHPWRRHRGGNAYSPRLAGPGDRERHDRRRLHVEPDQHNRRGRFRPPENRRSCLRCPPRLHSRSGDDRRRRDNRRLLARSVQRAGGPHRYRCAGSNRAATQCSMLPHRQCPPAKLEGRSRGGGALRLVAVKMPDIELEGARRYRSTALDVAPLGFPGVWRMVLMVGKPRRRSAALIRVFLGRACCRNDIAAPRRRRLSGLAEEMDAEAEAQERKMWTPKLKPTKSSCSFRSSHDRVFVRDTVKEWAGDSQWRALKADYQRFRHHGYSGWGSEGMWALVIYRAQRALRKSRRRFVWKPAELALAVLRKALHIITASIFTLRRKSGPACSSSMLRKFGWPGHQDRGRLHDEPDLLDRLGHHSRCPENRRLCLYRPPRLYSRAGNGRGRSDGLLVLARSVRRPCGPHRYRRAGSHPAKISVQLFRNDTVLSPSSDGAPAAPSGVVFARAIVKVPCRVALVLSFVF